MTYRQMLAFIATLDREYLDKEISVLVQGDDASAPFFVSIDDSEREAGAGTGPFLVGSLENGK